MSSQREISEQPVRWPSFPPKLHRLNSAHLSPQRSQKPVNDSIYSFFGKLAVTGYLHIHFIVYM